MLRNRKLIVSVFLLLMLMLAACAKSEAPASTEQDNVTEAAETKESSAKAEDGTAERIKETPAEPESESSADDSTYMNADGVICDLSGREDLSGYSIEELTARTGDEPVLFYGMSAEELSFLFADFDPEAEYEEVPDVMTELASLAAEDENLQGAEPETYEARPYNADAPWEENGVTFFDIEGEADSSTAKENSQESSGQAPSGEGAEKYAFLGLPEDASVYAEDGEYLATLTGDIALCKEYVEKVKAAGYTVDAEETDFMGMYMYEASDTSGEKASVAISASSIIISFETGD